MAEFTMGPYVRRWMERYAQQNLWRLPKWVTEEDLRQEGHTYWAVVNSRYKHSVSEVRHMMTLFMRCYRNRITDLAKRRTRFVQGDVSLHAPVADAEASCLADMLRCDEVEVEGAILDAPEPVKSILRLLVDAPEAIFAHPYRLTPTGSRETPAGRIREALAQAGAPLEPGVLPLKLVHQYLRKDRVRIEPTVVEVVGALAEARVAEPHTHTLSLRGAQTQYTREQISAYIRRRQRCFSVGVEVKHRGGRDHKKGGVRRWAQDTQPRIQVQECSWAQICAGVHCYRPVERHTGAQQPVDGDRLRRAETDHAGDGRGALGPRHAGMAGGPTPSQGTDAPGASQDRAPTMHSHSGGASRARLRVANSAAAGERAHADAAAPV